MFMIRKNMLRPAILATLIGVGWAMGGTAQADVHFNVRNCTAETIHINTYDGPDGSYTFTAEHFSLAPKNHSGSSKHTSCFHGCAWLDTSCKSHCQITARRNGVKRTQGTVHVPKNQYVRILTATHHYRDDIHEMGTAITYEISSSDKSCSDPVEGTHTLH